MSRMINWMGRVIRRSFPFWILALVNLALCCTVLYLGSVYLGGCTLLQQPPRTDSPHLLLGNPSRATASLSTPNNYLMRKPQYALSYNNQKHIPNWSSWQLNAAWLGAVPRRNDFRPDPDLPADWLHVTPSDYNGSGYDRGHMTPAADRGNTPENNSATFLMTNILPQAPDNNQGPWADLENYCRDLVRQGKELYIVAGGYGDRRPIKRGILPPAQVWKTIVVLDRPGLGLSGVTASTRVIAVLMPNQQGIRETDWRTFRVSVDAIEAQTGYDLLSNVPEAIQKVIEGRRDEVST